MANRVTEDDVKAIMRDCDTETDQITPFITTANTYVNTVFSGSGVAEANLTEIEKWLSAHFVAITICRSTKSEELGDAKVTYTGWWGTGLLMTEYGQMVLQLDTTGEILSQSKRKASIYAVKSFDD